MNVFAEFVRMVFYFNRTFIGYLAVVGVIAYEIITPVMVPELAMEIVAGIGAGWMTMIASLVVVSPFSSGVTEESWKPFLRKMNKQDRGEILTPEEMDEVEVTVAQSKDEDGKPMGLQTQLTFAIMMFITDMSRARGLRFTYRGISIALVLLGCVPLIYFGYNILAFAWFLYHVSLDVVLFQSAKKVQYIECTATD